MQKFTDEDRRIFGPYSNGKGEQVYGDPLHIYRRLLYSVGGSLSEVVKRARCENAEAKEIAENTILGATVQAFDVVAFDCKTKVGMTEAELFALFDSFIAWLGKKK